MMERRIFYPGVARPQRGATTDDAARERDGPGIVMAVPGTHFSRRRRTAFASGPMAGRIRMRPRRSKRPVVRPDGTPVRGAQVNARDADERTAVHRDASPERRRRGNFELVVSVAGPVSSRGAEPPAFHVPPSRPAAQSADYVPESDDAGRSHPAGAGRVAREHVDVTMRPLSGIVSGRILDDVGEPSRRRPGAAVQVARHTTAAGGEAAWTSARHRRTEHSRTVIAQRRTRSGQCAVSAAVGQIVVTQPSVQAPGFGTTYYPGTSDPQAIQFDARESITGSVGGGLLDSRACESARHRGSAVDAEGDPITGGIALMPSQRSGSNTDIRWARESTAREASSFASAAREYVLQVVHGRSGGWNEGEFAYRFISVVDADITDIELQTQPGSGAGRANRL